MAPVYSQFVPKEAIAIEAIRLVLGGSKKSGYIGWQKKGRKKAFSAVGRSYLSPGIAMLRAPVVSSRL